MKFFNYLILILGVLLILTGSLALGVGFRTQQLINARLESLSPVFSAAGPAFRSGTISDLSGDFDLAGEIESVDILKRSLVLKAIPYGAGSSNVFVERTPDPNFLRFEIFFSNQTQFSQNAYFVKEGVIESASGEPARYLSENFRELRPGTMAFVTVNFSGRYNALIIKEATFTEQ